MKSRLVFFAIAFVAHLFGVSSVLAQQSDCSNAWKPKYPSPRNESAVAYDTHRQRLIVYGGETSFGPSGDTWEWDGTNWAFRTKAGPGGLNEPRLAYDEERREVVLFGGYSGSTSFGETWVWNGSVWTKRLPVHSPSARSAVSMTYDRLRKKVVLFGGYDRALPGESNELWEWDGNDWENRTPASGPSGRRTAAFAYDPGRNVSVLFGGYDGNGNVGDTWEWDGSSWVERTPTNAPTAKDRITMAYDATRSVMVLLVPRYVYYAWEVDTWEWDGTDWTMRNAIVSPDAIEWASMAYFAPLERAVLFGGYSLNTGEKSSKVWGWNGTAGSWEIMSSAPSERSFAVMTFDSHRNRMVLYGGGKRIYNGFAPVSETWEEDGSKWKQITTPTSPPELLAQSMTFDSKRNVVVLFGGSLSFELSNQTWEYDGSDWVNRTPGDPDASPPKRANGGFSYDPVRQVSVLYGGLGEQSTLADTWEWDGTMWTKREPTVTPLERHDPRLVYNPVRSRTMLYGASVAYPADDSVWEWDGAQWSSLSSSPNPGGGRQDFGMVFDSNLNQVVLFGGDNWGNPSPITWGWNGSQWSDLHLGGMQLRNQAALAYDSFRGYSLLFGGTGPRPGDYYGVGGDTWMLNTSDGDQDGVMDCADGCLSDSQKSAPGVCGCGVADTDSDGDSTFDCLDSCAADPLKTAPGACGCGVADLDSDSDGTYDCDDACPTNPALDALGTCGCNTSDQDKDGTLDCADVCPGDAAKSSSLGICGCGVSDSDSDFDGSVDCLDQCPADGKKFHPGACGCGVSDDANGNAVLDCREVVVKVYVPARPRLKQVKKVVRVTAPAYSGAVYRIYWKVGSSKKAKSVMVRRPTYDIKGLKARNTVKVSYAVILPGRPSVSSRTSRETALKLR